MAMLQKPLPGRHNGQPIIICAPTSSPQGSVPYHRVGNTSAVYGDTVLYHTFQCCTYLCIFLFCVHMRFQAPEVEHAPDEYIGITAHRSGIDH